MATVLHPTVMWAQRKDTIFLTIDVQDCKDPKITIDGGDGPGKVTFRGLAHSHATGPEEHEYQLDLELNGEIDKDDVKQIVTDRTITLVIAKKEEGPHWPRLLKAAGKTPPYIKADWDKWVDEDEEDEADAMGGFDPAMMQQLGGMGGMPPGMMGMGGGGPGGPGGMDLAAMLSQMGGAGGAGGMDLSSLGDLAAGGGPGMEEEDDSEDDMPPLE